MREALFNVTIFPGKDDSIYNCPIGLSVPEPGGQLRVLAAPSGHHQELFDAYLRTLEPGEWPGSDAVLSIFPSALGWKGKTDPLPTVYYKEQVEMPNDARAELVMAARALWLTLNNSPVLDGCADGKTRQMRFKTAALESAVVHQMAK